MTSDVCLSIVYIGPKSRTERPRKTKIGTEVAHVTHDSDTTFKVKRSLKGHGHQATLVGCSSHFIIYMDDTSFYTTAQSELLSVDHEYLGSKARWVPQAAACGVQGRGILHGFLHSLFILEFC